MQKPATIFGRSKGISFTVITANQELKSFCLRKNYSHYHCDILMWLGEQMQILFWMCCWKAVKTIIGKLMATETYLTLGLVSRSSQYCMKNLQTDMHGPQGRLTKIQASTRLSQRFGQECQRAA